MKQNILLFILILLISGCSQKDIEPSFSLQEETSSITLASAANSQTVISFTSTREWKASTSSEWLLISPTSGEAGTYQMALTASSKNNSKNSRTATVNLVSAGLTQSFTVTQSPAEYVELEQTAYYTEAQGAHYKSSSPPISALTNWLFMARPAGLHNRPTVVQIRPMWST